jgi:DNA-binding beta-propeller fold protein YncE
MIYLSKAGCTVVGVVALLLAFVPAAHADFFIGTGSSADDSQVLRYDNTGNFLGVFVQSGHGLNMPRGLAFGPDGNFYVASSGSDSVLRYDGTTGAFIDTFIGPDAGKLHQPERLIFRGDGFLYVSTFGNDGIPGNSVLRYDAMTGAFDHAFVAIGDGGLVLAEDMLFGPDDQLYVASVGSASVLRFDGATGAFIDTFAMGLGSSSPRGIIFDANGNLLATSTLGGGDYAPHSVLQFAPDRTFLGYFVESGDGGLNFPRGIGFGPDGNFYVVSFFGNQVLKYDGATGAFLCVFIDGLDAPTYYLFN